MGSNGSNQNNFFPLQTNQNDCVHSLIEVTPVLVLDYRCLDCRAFCSMFSLMSQLFCAYSGVSNTHPVLNKSPGGKIGQKQ